MEFFILLNAKKYKLFSIGETSRKTKIRILIIYIQLGNLSNLNSCSEWSIQFNKTNHGEDDFSLYIVKSELSQDIDKNFENQLK